MNLLMSVILLTLYFGYQTPVLNFPSITEIFPFYRALGKEKEDEEVKVKVKEKGRYDDVGFKTCLGFPVLLLWSWTALVFLWQHFNVNYV